MLALELLPGIRPEDVGCTATASVTRLGDRWTVHLVVNTDVPAGRCRMLTGDTNANTGSTPLLGWLHTSSCDLTQALVSGSGDGRCTGGTTKQTKETDDA